MFQDLILSYLIDKFIFSHPEAIKIDTGYRCRCRICGDSKKSNNKMRLNYYSATTSVYCFNCGFSGTLLKYLAHSEGKTQKDLKTEIIKDNKIIFGKSEKLKSDKKVKEELKDIVCTNDSKAISEVLRNYTYLPDKVKQYLADRKIFDAPFYDANTSLLWDDKKERIIIPWYYKGLPIYYQSRRFTYNSQPKYLFPKSHRVLFYNADKLDKNIPYLFLLESAFDSIFVKNGLATGSINITNLQKDLLKKYFKDFQIIYMCDNPFIDDAAKNLIYKLGKDNHNIKIFILPEKYRKYKDINEVCIGENNVNIFNNIDFLLTNTMPIGKTLAMLKLNK